MKKVVSSDFKLVDIFPNATMGLSNIGFFFGAGTSLDAGYPLMRGLTECVLHKLDNSEFSTLDGVVKRVTSKSIKIEGAQPNIEEITDILESAIFNYDKKSREYEELLGLQLIIRDSIVNVMNDVEKPNLEDHILFFSALRSIFEGRSETVWIFTPNYDLLFELAASHVKVPLIRGFIGTSLRYFDINSLKFDIGEVRRKGFLPLKRPIFRLIKLHGSLDWWKEKTENPSPPVYSTQHPKQIKDPVERVMVLPRRQKVRETLDHPYNEIFRFAQSVLGTRCKYLVSCGYSYGDEHINTTLLLPKLQNREIRLVAFLKDDTSNLDPFKQCRSFSFGTEGISKKEGNINNEGTELWQFKKLVDLLVEHAGYRSESEKV